MKASRATALALTGRVAQPHEVVAFDAQLAGLGLHQPQSGRCRYRVNRDHRVRQDHPRCRVAAGLDITFVRAEVPRGFGHNGNEGVDPISLVKLRALLSFDDLPSERELMKRLPGTSACPEG